MSVVENAIRALKEHERSFQESSKVAGVSHDYLLRLRLFQSLLNAIVTTGLLGGKNVASRGNAITYFWLPYSQFLLFFRTSRYE